MGTFEWGTYTEGGGGSFVSEVEMMTYIASGIEVAITGVRDGRSARFDKEQWYVDFTDDKGEERTKSFSKGNSERDGRMARLRDTLAATNEPIAARFIKVGRRYDVAGA